MHTITGKNRQKQKPLIRLVYLTVLALLTVDGFRNLYVIENTQTTVFLMQAVILLVSAAGVYFSVVEKNFNLPWSLFWVFVFLFFGLTGAYQIPRTQFPWLLIPQSNYVIQAQSEILIGLLAASFIYFLKPPSIIKKINAHSLNSRDSVPISKVLTALLLIQIITTALYIFLIGPAIFTGKRNFQAQIVYVADNYPMGGFLFTLTTCLTLIVPCTSLLFNKLNKDKVSVALIFSGTALGLVLCNPLTGSRFLTGAILVSLLAALTYNGVLYRYLPLFLILVFVFLFPTLDFFRGDASSSKSIELLAPSISFLSPDFDAFEMLIRVNLLNGQIPFGLPRPAELIFSGFLNWIPGISEMFVYASGGYVVARATNMGYTNVSMPLWGEGILAGGVLGVVIYLALIGGFFKMLRPSNPIFITANILLQPASAGVIFIILRGSLSSVLVYVLAILALLSVFWRSGLNRKI